MIFMRLQELYQVLTIRCWNGPVSCEESSHNLLINMKREFSKTKLSKGSLLLNMINLVETAVTFVNGQIIKKKNIVKNYYSGLI